ncbi:transglycosylase domain-containing protein [Sinomonas sp. ASV322]|uniref:transglycosylase domain-containing protein n=1 Tax=Sinomonas sp. ASV322 TaxID=3041920 RepID=UPI0027DC0F06|nr:transglycosylase domain-containing protein [Sinomonas sp. ASV322]MDQ4503937.1 transglycosylase domain-containing protein [Sinomonas sp. ASV322]
MRKKLVAWPFATSAVFGRILSFVGVSALCGVLVAGLIMPAAAVVGSAAGGTAQIFDRLPSELIVAPPGQVTRILAADGSQLATLFSENRTPVKLDDMSPNIKNAIVAVEDYRFYEHGGVDMSGILRAAVANLRGGRQGASTITQQYVTNVLNDARVAQGRQNEVVVNGQQKGYGDKLREIKLAIALERQYSKEQILEGYLNIVFFNRNAYGIQAASQYYFSVDAKDLSLTQAATLAGLVNGPAFFDPIQAPEASAKRRNLVLGAMLEHGYINQRQYDEAVASPLQTKASPPRQGCAYAAQAPYFCDFVVNQILGDSAYGSTPEERARTLSRGGLTIKTTLDPRLQGPAQDQVDSTAGANPDTWGASLVTVQPGTGKILAMAQNTRMLKDQGLDFVTAYNFNVDAHDAGGNDLGGAGGFQPGSTMKPVTLSAWLGEGRATNQYVDASRRRYGLDHPWKTTCSPVTGSYDSSQQGSLDLQNDEPTWYRRMTVREGVYQSINTATFASAAALSDFCNIQRAADSLGIHKGEGQGKKLDLSTLGNLLGGENVAPMTMASAFATFAANGTYCEPISISEVTDSRGKRLGGQAQRCIESAVKPDVAKAVTNVLEDVLTKGSGLNIKDAGGRPIKVGVPVAAKTGTNQYNSQTWVVGYTRGLATASFFGEALNDPSLRNGRDVWVNGRHYRSVDGAFIAGPQWAQYMQKAAPLFDRGDFDPPPRNLITG